MSAVFTPLGLVFGVLAGQVSEKLFDVVWGAVDDEEAPRPKHREIPCVKLLAAPVIEGAIFRVVRGLVDHGARQGWLALTAAWPGEERQEPE
jgi:Protein of unknown function (DUF4235)